MRTLLPLGLMLAAGCAIRYPGPTLPTTYAEVSDAEVVEWVAQTAIESARAVRFRWRLQNSSATGTGRGAAMLLPGDSMRFDFRLPLGAGAGAAAVIGDTALWAEPEEEVRKLVPSFQLLWALLGRARPPAPGSTVRGYHDERIVAWRVIDGADTTDYLVQRAPRRALVVDARVGGRRVGRAYTVFDGEGRLHKSRLDVPSESARLDLEFYGHRAISGIADSLWIRPSDAP